ncbi:MAG TPA: thaumatin family protein [Polyangiaceae bacterium]
MRDGKFLASLGVVLLVTACGGGTTSSNSAAGAPGAAGAGTSAGGALGTPGAAGAYTAGAPMYAAGASGAPMTESGGGGASAGSPGSAGSAPVGSAGTLGGSGMPIMAPMTATPVGDQTQPRKLYIENRCPYEIWNFAQPQNTFPGSVPYKMEPNTAIVVGWPDKWSGRTWARTQCTGSGGNLSCAQKNGPDTLVEFTLTAGMNSDWYDISLVDGFTIPAAILQLDSPWTPDPSYVVGGPLGADQICGSPVCAVDLLPNCPAASQRKDPAGNVTNCQSGPKGSDAAKYMKAGCPTSYSYDFDDPQSLFRCPTAVQNGGKGSKDYDVIYCPTQGATAGFP